MKIIFSKQAIEDLNNISNYLVNIDFEIKKITIKKIKKLIDKLLIFPSLGKVGPTSNTRELIVPNTPYKIIYQVTEDIGIIAVLHERRRWND